MQLKQCLNTNSARMAATLGLLFLFIISPVSAEEPAWDDYATVLERHVSSQQKHGVRLNWVDYTALKKDPLWPRVIEQVQNFPTSKLAGEKERLAFYINTYNILAMKTVTDNWPLESIKDAGSLFSPVWKKNAGKIDGKDVSLDQIEHEILRKMGEPRMHMAIVCASVSCPDLRREPFTAEKLDSQLDDQSAAFLSNPAKGVHLSGNQAEVTKIFDWFGEDFEKLGGVQAFIGRYVTLPADVELDGYLPYNWSVNGQ